MEGKASEKSVKASDAFFDIGLFGNGDLETGDFPSF
jgi:hypothetical protein